MKLCTHPPSEVTADILEGDTPSHQVQWCRLCGAIRLLRYGSYGHWKSEWRAGEWREPEHNKDVTGLDSRHPVVLYFESGAEADDFIKMVQEAHPNLTERKI